MTIKRCITRIEFGPKPPICHSCGEAEMERQVSQTGPWKFGGEK